MAMMISLIDCGNGDKVQVTSYTQVESAIYPASEVLLPGCYTNT